MDLREVASGRRRLKEGRGIAKSTNDSIIQRNITDLFYSPIKTRETRYSLSHCVLRFRFDISPSIVAATLLASSRPLATRCSIRENAKGEAEHWERIGAKKGNRAREEAEPVNGRNFSSDASEYSGSPVKPTSPPVPTCSISSRPPRERYNASTNCVCA